MSIFLPSVVDWLVVVLEDFVVVPVLEIVVTFVVAISSVVEGIGVVETMIVVATVVEAVVSWDKISDS